MFISAVIFENKSITTASNQALTCTISGLSQNTPVTWIDPDNEEISESDSEKYVIDQGEYDSGSKSSTLTIAAAKISSLSTGDLFKCKVRSALYPTYSPDIVKEMVLTLLAFGTVIFILKFVFPMK